MKINEILSETIRKVEGGYRLVSHKGKNLGTFPTKAGAEKHEREVQYFKHMSEAGGGHYDMPTKSTFMVVVSDGTKKQDLMSAEDRKKAVSIARSLRSKYPDKTVTIEPRKVVAQQYNEENLTEFASDDSEESPCGELTNIYSGIFRDLKLPYYSIDGKKWVEGISKGEKRKFDKFESVNLRGRSWFVVGILPDGRFIEISNSPSEMLSNCLAKAYNLKNKLR
jgi:hypothetical protein